MIHASGGRVIARPDAINRAPTMFGAKIENPPENYLRDTHARISNSELLLLYLHQGTLGASSRVPEY